MLTSRLESEEAGTGKAPRGDPGGKQETREVEAYENVERRKG